MITVKDLKAALQDLPDDMQIVLSSYDEGNSFAKLAEVEVGKYIPDDDYYASVVHPDDVHLYDADYDLEDVVVLWP